MRNRPWLNVGCGPFRAPEPWVNLDVHVSDSIRPDVVVEDPDRPLAGWGDGTVDRVYLGHVLEHIAWPDVPEFLADIRRALHPDGEVCAVGPDVFRAIRRWRDGLDPEGWQLIESILEGPWDRDYDTDGYGLIERLPAWPQARHQWNSYEKRVVVAFHLAGFSHAEGRPIDPDALGGWPLVAYTQWQCAVVARP